MTDKASKDQRRRDLLDQHRRAARQRLKSGISDRVLGLARSAARSREMAERLKATLDPARPNPKTRRAIKDHELQARRAEIEATRIQREDINTKWAIAANAESVGLALNRGEEIASVNVETNHVDTGRHGDEQNIVTTQSSPLSILSGIEDAYAKGHLSHLHGGPKAEILQATGQIYRQAFEIAIGRIGPSGDGGGGGGAKGPQLRGVEAADRLRIMRSGQTPRRIRILDLVCGGDERVRKAADLLNVSGSMAIRCLRGALVIAAANWTDAQRSGLTGQAAKLVETRIQMLDEMTPNSVR